jgi:cystathionine beta-lyase/cystathionine gamma-synthase
MRPSTEAIQRRPAPCRGADPLTLPIYETTTFVFESAEQVRAYNEGRHAGYLYSRYGNPTVASVEQTLAALEGAEAALVLASGQAATTTALLALAAAGDEVVCSRAIYGGTRHLVCDLLPRLGIGARLAGLADLRDPVRLFSPRTKVVWFESPINPTLRCVDIQAIAAACRSRGVIAILDNTFASPVNQQPLALGADIVMHSATKYLNGHSDVTAGVLAGPAALIGRMERMRRVLGTVLDPQPAYALGRGLKTLAVRMARQNASALAIARWLERDARVDRVYYPGLPDHPDHQVASRQMRGFGGMICIDLGGEYARAARLFDRLAVIQRAASLGGVESLCSLPVLTSHWGQSAEQLQQAGITPGMVRLSIGLEDVDDLIGDLDQALG